MKWCSVDTIDKCLGDDTPFILNSDISSGKGYHWLCCYEYSPNHLFIIDPLGPKNYRPYNNIMMKILKENNYDVIYYPFKFQQQLSNLCGEWSIWVAKIIEELKNEYEEVTPRLITKKLVSLVGRTADKKDVLQLIDAFGTKY